MRQNICYIEHTLKNARACKRYVSDKITNCYSSVLLLSFEGRFELFNTSVRWTLVRFRLDGIDSIIYRISPLGPKKQKEYLLFLLLSFDGRFEQDYTRFRTGKQLMRNRYNRHQDRSTWLAAPTDNHLQQHSNTAHHQN